MYRVCDDKDYCIPDECIAIKEKDAEVILNSYVEDVKKVCFYTGKVVVFNDGMPSCVIDESEVVKNEREC